VKVLWLLPLIAIGCKPADAPCMGMGAPSDLVTRAAVLRLDVYDGDVHCDGAGVTAGAPAPSLTKVVTAGQPIKLDIPGGKHVLLLSAFSDAGSTQLLGSACTEADLTADASACFMLTLVEAPDFAMPQMPPCDGGTCACTTVPDNCPVGMYCGVDGNCAAGCKVLADCASTADAGVGGLCNVASHRCVQCLGPADCPAGKRCSPSGSCVDGCDTGSPCPGSIACCSMLCIDTSMDISSCGACSRPCDSAGVATASCNGGLCTSACVAGKGNCNKPIAPNPDDGCETNVYDVANCGTCNHACSLPNATPDCPAGTCVIKTCNASYFDCNNDPANGCECQGVDLLDGMKGCCPGGSCQVTHSDGYSHSFFDCTAFGTYSLQLATDASKAYSLAGQTDTLCDTANCVGATIYCVRKRPAGVTQECVCWAFAGAAAGHTKHVLADCGTPAVSDTAWK
jgi:hypothetical protein